MVDSVVFIGAIIIAATQAVKFVWPKVNGAVTIIIAILVGVIIALLAPYIGVAHITVAQGVMIALAAVGVHTTARQIG